MVGLDVLRMSGLGPAPQKGSRRNIKPKLVVAARNADNRTASSTTKHFVRNDLTFDALRPRSGSEGKKAGT